MEKSVMDNILLQDEALDDPEYREWVYGTPTPEPPKDADLMGPTISKADYELHGLIEYLFNEDTYLAEAAIHIDGTYSGHYGGEIQPTEVIIDSGHGTGFNIGNIIKYAKRYGRKNGYNRKDLLKIIHYAIMQLYVHDKEGLGDTKSAG